VDTAGNRGNVHEATPIARTSKLCYADAMSELIFEVTQEEDGGFVAECLTEHLFTQADTWAELRHNVREAVGAYHFDRPLPASVRLHLVRDEVLAVA
jgi:predicted RNase H-like HicB family nuclease